MSETANTKASLLKMIDELERNPNDRIRILGDAGITMLGTALGFAAASTIAAATGVTSIAGITTAAGWIGLTIVAATPVGWIVGCSALASVAAYSVTRLIRNGSHAEAKKSELAVQFREQARSVATRENAQQTTTSERTAFILSLREPVAENLLTPDTAFRLIEQVERGGIPLTEASKLVQAVLADKLSTFPIPIKTLTNISSP